MNLRTAVRLSLSLALAGSLLFGGTAWAAKGKAAEMEKVNALLRDYQGDLVLIKGKTGTGSGFIANIKGRKVLVTNAHVLAGLKSPTYTLLNRARLQVSSAAVAVGHDLVVLAVVEGGTGMPTVNALTREAELDDVILVLGNPGGGGVVTPLTGKLLGIGPNRIEIDAPIERGSSGSPIIHLASGNVIGVATDALADELLSGETKVRRFGYRLDSVPKWQPVDWTRFHREADLLDKIETTTRELNLVFEELDNPTSRSRTSRTRRYAYETPAIRTALDTFYTTLTQDNGRTERASRSLLSALQATSQSDVASAKPSLNYDYFQRRLAQQATIREQMMKVFTKALQP